MPTATRRRQILARIGQLNLEPILIAVTRMLAGYKDVRDATNWRQVPGSRQLADKCWNSIDTASSAVHTGGGATMEARNHPAGNLAGYWLQELKDEWNWLARKVARVIPLGVVKGPSAPAVRDRQGL